eukprot:CAMPEP_0182594102 /NCGR_PEP_ID=MMETSP1324-20130603/79436_1 /TAXON_ID=236786 /ORGANISM="Florenciella sp., Strain RCC1587" /LENGTH=134 /DNA_ID=CAMNT_0024811617 /DNA_START=44 /DNA_END=448 /DNA_ORIENTATION=-
MLRCLAPRLSPLAGRGDALPPALGLMAVRVAEAAMSASTSAATPYPTYFVAGARPIVSWIPAARPFRPPYRPMQLPWPSWGGAAAISAAMKVSSPWSQQIREGSTMKKRRTKMNKHKLKKRRKAMRMKSSAKKN